MSKVCEISGKRPIVANSIQRRGKAKREGGVGKKTTGISKRRTRYPYAPNQFDSLHDIYLPSSIHS